MLRMIEPIHDGYVDDIHAYFANVEEKSGIHSNEYVVIFDDDLEVLRVSSIEYGESFSYTGEELNAYTLIKNIVVPYARDEIEKYLTERNND